MLRRQKEQELTSVDMGSGKKVAQVETFRSLVTKPNKDAFIQLLEQASKSDKPITQDGLVLQLMGKRSGQHGIRLYFKLNIAGESFFVKQASASNREIYGGGSEEVESSREAQKLLANMPGVRVVDYKFGLQDNYNSIYISEWDGALQVRLKDYLENLGMQIIQKLKENTDCRDLIERKRVLSERVYDIKLKLQGYCDVTTRNMAFDEKTGDIIVFDLTKKPPRQEESKKIKIE